MLNKVIVMNSYSLSDLSFVLFCFVLSCFVFCIVLFCFVLFCFVFFVLFLAAGVKVLRWRTVLQCNQTGTEIRHDELIFSQMVCKITLLETFLIIINA